MKILFLTLGFLSVGLGIIGIILPVLPTTPLLLLGTVMFSKSSDRINEKFTSSRLYKRFLQDFIENKTITRKRKWTLLISVDIILLIVFLSLDNNYLKTILIVLFLVKHWYFAKYIKVL